MGRPVGKLAVLVLGFLTGCGGDAESPVSGPPVSERQAKIAAAIDLVERTEAVLDGLLPGELRRLARSVENLQLPAAESRVQFADSVEVIDLAGPGEVHEIPDFGVTVRDWQPADGAVAVDRGELAIWRQLFEDVDHFQHAGFKVISGHFTDAAERLLETKTKFQGLARVGAGYRYAEATLLLEWEQAAGENGSGEADWRIRKWATKQFTTEDVDQLFFTDVLEQTVDPGLYAALVRRSSALHHRIRQIVASHSSGITEQELSQLYDLNLVPFSTADFAAVMPGLSPQEREYVELRYGYRARPRQIARALEIRQREVKQLARSVNRRLLAARGPRAEADKALRAKRRGGAQPDQDERRSIPASNVVGVTDFDRDGLDDLFVARNESTYLLRNRGDGTFEDYTARVRLPQAEGRMLRSALFLDTDNDDDLDLLLGYKDDFRYFLNEGGRFVDRTGLVDAYRPVGLVALSAADYDGDGLIDVYLQTHDMFGPAMELMARSVVGVDGEAVYPAQLPPTQARRFYEHATSPTAHASFHRPSSPNILLRNLGGGRFGIAPNSEPLELYLSTHFATWSDYDNDGDPDLYVANDFGPNNFFRNDDGVLIDITGETGTADTGFGMGVSWGDYDNDGDHDVYVTNMYSKAGLRITQQAGLTDSRVHIAAHGNTLFRNDGDSFPKVSSRHPPGLVVENGGWGWGSQFLDVDNDGFLDIYAPAGYYSIPAGMAAIADT